TFRGTFRSPDLADLAVRLPVMHADERVALLRALSEGERRELLANSAFADSMRQYLSEEDFAAARELLINPGQGVEVPLPPADADMDVAGPDALVGMSDVPPPLPAGPVRADSSGSSVSEDSERMSPEDAMWSKFERDRRELWHRINGIHRLSDDADFREGVKLFLENIERDLRAGKATEVDHGAIAAIMKGLHQKGVRGHKVQYAWYKRNQDKPGFEESVEAHAEDSAAHGGLWSKLGSALPIEVASVAHGAVLEDTMQGYLFDGLLFGLSSWNASAALGELWEQLSQSYVLGLKGWATAHVLDGTTESSVLNRIEWPTLRGEVEAGRADGLNVVVYRAVPDSATGRLVLVPIDTFPVRTQEDFDRVPKVQADAEWYRKQSQVNSEQRDELVQVHNRQRELEQLDSYVTGLFGKHGRSITFRPTLTPHVTFRGTFHLAALADLAVRLPVMHADERAARLAELSAEDRRTLSVNKAFMASLRRHLVQEEFAKTWELLVGTDEPLPSITTSSPSLVSDTDSQNPSPAPPSVTGPTRASDAAILRELDGTLSWSGTPNLARVDPETEALSRFRFADDSDGDVSVEGGLDPVPQAWTDLLFGAAARNSHSAETLRDIARSVWDLANQLQTPSSVGTSVLDGLHNLTRRVLSLDPDGPVNGRDLLLMGSLALSASPEERSDEQALADRLTRQDIVLTEESSFPPGRGAGRNWIGTGQTPAVDSYTAQDEDGRLIAWPVPWRDAYMVLAQPAGRSVQLYTPDGRLKVDAAELARLVARDPTRPEGADVVLAFPHDDIAPLARTVADLTGSRVWYSELAPHSATDWRTGAEHLMLGPSLDGGARAWVSLLPGEDAYGRAPVVPSELIDPAPESTAAIDARRARRLLTRDYGVMDQRGDGFLFRKPGPIVTRLSPPRALEGVEGAPALALFHQDFRETSTAQRPVLQISEDRTLAAEHRVNGQQVFATVDAISRSSEKLRRAGITTRLEMEPDVGIVLPLPDGGARRLYLVRPVFGTSSGRSTEEVCRDFADMLAGNSRTSHLVFRDPHGGPVVAAPANASDGVEVTGTHHLAQGLASVADGELSSKATGPAWAAERVRADDRPTGGDGTGPLPGERYGSALNLAEDSDPRREALSAASQEIGINEHAWADVGESYVFQSIAAAGEDGQPSLAHNYAKPSLDATATHFGYHFATVLLASEDGTHQVSIENHTRVSVRKDRHKRTIAENLDRFSGEELREHADQLLTEIRRREGTATSGELAELRSHRFVTEALAHAQQAHADLVDTPEGSSQRAEADRRLRNATQAAMTRIGQLEPVIPGKHLWYMRMFAQRPGESPHDSHAHLTSSKPSIQANPLTAVVIRGQQAVPATVTFPEGVEQTPGEAVYAIRHLAKVVARVALWNSSNGLQLPQVNVTSRHGAGVGRKPGRSRAEVVAASFRQELAAALTNLQEGVRGAHLTADQVTVVPGTARRRPAFAREPRTDTVDITVDDRRGGARQIATRGPRSGVTGGLRGGSPDDGLDPVVEQWAIGRPVTVMRPRFGGGVRPVLLSSGEVPVGVGGSVRGKGVEAGGGQWFAYVRSAESRVEPFTYEVADSGHVRMPGGLEIPPTGWVRFGDDFVHTRSGVLLRGDSGWLGRVANMDTLGPALADLDPSAAPFRVTADSSSLYLVPDGEGDVAYRIALHEDPAPHPRPHAAEPRGVSSAPPVTVVPDASRQTDVGSASNMARTSPMAAGASVAGGSGSTPTQSPNTLGGNAHPPLSVGAAVPLPKASQPHLEFIDGRTELDAGQRDHVHRLARRMVVATMRDLSSGLRIPLITVTEVDDGSRSAPGPGTVRLSTTVKNALREAIRDEMLTREAELSAVSRIRGKELNADDFPFDLRNEADSSASKPGSRRVLINVERSPLARSVDTLKRLLPQLDLYSAGNDVLDLSGVADFVVLRPDGVASLSGGGVPANVSSLDVDAVPDDVRVLFELVGDAVAAGRADSVAALSAFHLSRQGVFAGSTRLLGVDGRPRGRNWSGLVGLLAGTEVGQRVP
ncbi:hypothetical protein AB0L72_35375, partial [Streptomyces parvulus]